MRFQFGAQITHHAFDFTEDDGDGDRIWRFGNAGGGIAFRCAGGDADKLPRRRQPAHNQDEAVKKNVGLACRSGCWRFLRRRRIEKRFDRINLLALKGAQMVREPPRQIGQHIAAAEDAGKR